MNSAVDVSQTPPVRRVAKFSQQAKVLGEIYQPECNLAVWQRGVEVQIKQYLDAVAATGRKIFLRSLISTGDEMATNLQSELGQVLPKLPDEREAVGRQMLMDNVLELFEMYECLFEAKEIGVRMASLDKAMCAKFHVDRLPARLVTCYSGEGTHWLPEPPVGG